MSLFLQISPAKIENLIPIDQIPPLVNRQAAVGVAVVGKTDVHLVLNDIPPQALDMGGPRIRVNIESIWLRIDHMGFSAQRFENVRRDVPGAAVGTIQSDLFALKAVHRE